MTRGPVRGRYGTGEKGFSGRIFFGASPGAAGFGIIARMPLQLGLGLTAVLGLW